MLERLARFTIHHRKLVVSGWLVLTLFGAFSASKINKRWLDQFSIPGYSAYEGNQRVLKTFGPAPIEMAHGSASWLVVGLWPTGV